MTADHSDPRVLLRLPWRTGTSVVAGLGLTGFVALLAVAAIDPWTPKLEFPVFRVAIASVCVVLGYYGLCTIVNATIVSLERGMLRVQHGPLWRFGFGPSLVAAPVADIVAIEHAVLAGIRARLRDETTILLLEPPSAQREQLAAVLAEALAVPCVSSRN